MMTQGSSELMDKA
jgi:hypothetical protein